MPASNAAAEKRSQPQILVETAGLSEEEWLAYRRKGIGGSDVAALLGISPWRTARDLYFDKLNIVAVEDNEDNWVALEMGHLLEPLVAKIFQHRTRYKIYQIKKMFQHPQYSWMLADVDYFVELPDGSTAILEIKTTNYNARDNWWLNDEETVPVYYEAQGRHYMAVMNLDRCFFCCLYGNNEDETIIREIRRDESYEEEMIFLEQYFWENHVLKSLAFSSLLDAVTAIPPLAYLIIFVGIWGNSIPTMLVALTVSLILRMIKLVKTQTELELDKAYVLCAVSSGASRSRVLFVHTVAAHQTIDQRLDAHRAQAYLAVADNNTGLHNVTGYDLCLQTGVDDLDVHTAVGELAALEVHPFHLLQDWKDNPGNIEVVDAPVAVAEKRPRCAVYGANHTHSRLPLEPCIHILRQQFGIFLQHLVIIGCRDLEVRSDLPVCDGVDLQWLHGIITRFVVSVEIQPATKRLQSETPGVQHIIGLQIVLPLDFLCHFHKTDP